MKAYVDTSWVAAIALQETGHEALAAQLPNTPAHR
jgi:hypothetical protein